MKAIRGMKRGVKLDPQLSKAERLEDLAVKFENSQMAGRMTQMMVQQLMQNIQALGKDLGKAFGVINELQYKIMSIQKLGAERAGFDTATLQKYAEELRLNDFIEASDAEDKAGNFTIGEKVEPGSTVIITSTTPGEDAGIFRSRIRLAECGVPALIQGLIDQAVGAKVKCQLNGAEHDVELLAIRNPPPVVVEEVPQATAADLPTASDTVN